MPNVNTSKVLYAGKKEAIIYLTIDSDGTDETDLVVYDSSAIATSAGDTDPTDSTIISVYATMDAANTARAYLEWDASTDVHAFTLVPQAETKGNFRAIGGLPNQGGSGVTGDITLTTTGLESGDNITLVLHVRRD